MASVFKQKLYDLSEPEAQLRQLETTKGLRTVVTTLDPSATPLSEFAMDQRDVVLVVGNEADGVDPSIQAAASDRVTIPMRMGTDSLNVAVAAAVFMHQIAEKS